jgi:hypothetical protein
MRPVMVVWCSQAVVAAGSSSALSSHGARATSPEGADEALDDGVAGRATHGRRTCGRAASVAERAVVGAGVLRAVIGAQFDAVGHMA